jgi:predicted nucleic acid-binding protein
VKIVVDSNIVFSAILNTESHIGQILILGSKYFDFYSINLLKQEIFGHKDKILKISGLEIEAFEKITSIIFSKIRFLDEVLISSQEVGKAIKLTKSIDENDTLFVALTNQLKAKLWTGDKKLLAGLKVKGYNQAISTSELLEDFLEKGG